MIRRVKNWLGIEGVKLELELSDSFSLDGQEIEGKVVFLSKTEQEVTRLNITMVERYSRGRGESMKIDEYLLGTMELEEPILIPAEQPMELKFSLPFKVIRSEMDQYAKRNFLLRGLVRTAKWASKVKSVYYIIAEAKVKGVALDPFDKKVISPA
ncbi:MAG: sporulation protein [Saprospiraceae bacterium]|nr:sporulation protein [Saprospiraceae bacterium]